MKSKGFIILVLFILVLSACSNRSSPDEDSQAVIAESSSSMDEREKNFLENFSDAYPDFELLDYTRGSEETLPIQLVAIAKEKETGSSSTLFVLDKNGTGQVVLAGEYPAVYRKEDQLRLDKNVISVSLDVTISDTRSEIHDFLVTVTQEEQQGLPHTVYASQETIRQD